MRTRIATPAAGRGSVGCAVGLASGLGVLLMSALVQASDPMPPESAPAGSAEPGAVHKVSQRDKAFAPGEISVEVGDQVTFLNDDEISHNVFSRSDGARFNLMIQRPGEHKSHRFERPGTTVVRCAIHPKMKLVVNVAEPGGASAKVAPAEVAP